MRVPSWRTSTNAVERSKLNTAAPRYGALTADEMMNKTSDDLLLGAAFHEAWHVFVFFIFVLCFGVIVIFVV